MSKFFWIATGGAADPILGTNWQKDDGTTTTIPGASDDIFFQPVSGLALASVWASGGVGSPATSLNTTGAATTGGHLAQNTTYYYYVTALYANGESPISSELVYTIGATGTATNTVSVNWTAPAGTAPTGYKIYRSTTTTTEQYLATVGAVLTYADTSATTPQGLPPGIINFTSMTISAGMPQSWTIGNAGAGGYWSIAGATTWTIGAPAQGGSNGQGSGRIKINFGAAAFAGTVLAMGASADGGKDALRILGSNAANVLNVSGPARVSVANNQPGETSNVTGGVNVTFNQAFVTLGAGVTWTGGANVSGGGSLTVNSTTTGPLNVASGSTATSYGAAAISTIVNSGIVKSNATGTIAAFTNLSGGVADFSGNGTARIVTVMTSNPGSKILRFAAAPDYLTIGTHHKPNVNSETFA